MTFTTISVSATKKRDPQKYKWYQLAKGRAMFDSAHKDFELELNKGDKFGMKFYRGSYFLVDESDLTLQFKLSVEEGKKLIAASKSFSGKVAGKKVEGGEAETAKPVRKSSTNKSEGADVTDKIFGNSKAVTRLRSGKVTWSKRGAAGKKQLRSMVEKAKDNGFKKEKVDTNNSPDGASSGLTERYMDVAGNLIEAHSRRGSSSRDSSYEVSFTPADRVKRDVANKEKFKQAQRDSIAQQKARTSK